MLWQLVIGLFVSFERSGNGKYERRFYSLTVSTKFLRTNNETDPAPLVHLGLRPAAAFRQSHRTRRPGQETFLKRGVSAEGKVWLLSDAGQLFSIEQGKNARTLESPPVPIGDICRRDGQVIAAGATDGKWRIFRHDDTWAEVATGALEKDERLSALLCTGDTITLLTSHRVLATGADTRSIRLNGEVQTGQSAVYATPSRIYLGANWGEWSGMLQTIDRVTGKVSPTWRAETSLCTAILCGNVTGISALPWRADCVAVTTGLIHFEPHGRVWQVCPHETPERLYFTAYDPKDKLEANGEPFSTVAFYGVIPEGDALLVVGMDGLYHLNKDGQATYEALPEFETIGGFKISFANPNVILVLTDINSRRSVGGSVPMLIER